MVSDSCGCFFSKKKRQCDCGILKKTVKNSVLLANLAIFSPFSQESCRVFSQSWTFVLNTAHLGVAALVMPLVLGMLVPCVFVFAVMTLPAMILCGFGKRFAGSWNPLRMTANIRLSSVEFEILSNGNPV